jgi:hypothetical protein
MARNSSREYLPLVVRLGWRVSPPTGKALAFDPLKGLNGAVCIVVAQLGAGVVAKVEFAKVAL